MESSKMSSTLPKQIQNVVLENRIDTSVTLFIHFYLFPAHLIRPTLHHLEDWVRATDMCEGTKRFIANGIESIEKIIASTATISEGKLPLKLNFLTLIRCNESMSTCTRFSAKEAFPNKMGLHTCEI